MVKSIISSKVEVRESVISGIGTFAKEAIFTGEVVFIKGGYILKRDEMYTTKLGDIYWPLWEDYVLAPRDASEVKDIKLFINHSCDPNCGIHGDITGVALRNIAPGEEITFDYAMLDNDDYSFNCSCGADCCRGVVTGYDWKLPALQKKYYGYFAAYLQCKIDNQK